jgi:outer membrane protein assembly factor BamB
MKLTKQFLALITFITAIEFFYGCKTEAIKPNLSIPSKLELDTLWSYTINDYSIKPQINLNGDILISRAYNDNSGEKFELIDGKIGEKKWDWSNFFQADRGFSTMDIKKIDNQIVLTSRNNSYSFDIQTGKTVWRNSSSLIGEVGNSLDNEGNIYQGFLNGINQTFIYRTNIKNGDQYPVCSFKDSIEGHKIGITTTSITKNNLDEKLVIYSILIFYKENEILKGISKLIAFNITQNKFEWIKDYTNKYIEFMTSAPIATDNQVYYFARYGSNHFLVCINSNDGTVKWERAIPYLGTDKFLYKNSIVVMSLGAQPVLSINKETGDLIWQRDFTEQEKQNINFEFGDGVVFKNYLFSTECDNLLVLNLDNGNIVYNKKISLPNGCLQYGVAIDEARRVFYVQDRYRIICYKLPKEIVY